MTTTPRTTAGFGAIEGTRREPGREVFPKATGERVSARLRRVVLLTGATFLALQVAVAFDSVAGTPQATTQSFSIAITGGVVGFTGFGVLGVLLALRGRGLFAAVPAGCYVLLGIVFTANHEPTPIGGAWSLPCAMDCSRPWLAGPWIGALVDLALVLIPIMMATRSIPRPFPIRAGALTKLSVGIALALVAMTYRTVAVLDNPPEISVIFAVVSFGLLAGFPRPHWLVGHAVMATASTGTAAAVLVAAALAPSQDFGLNEGIPYFTNSLLPLLGLTLAASVWHPVRSAIIRLREHQLALLLVANFLNVADAILTAVAVRSGAAVELNPVVRYGGLPLKVIVVALASAIVYRIRPRALIWPTLILFLVFAYHLNGLFIPR